MNNYEQSPLAAPNPKMTNWAKEPTLLSLKDELRLAEGAHSVIKNKIDDWNDLMNVRGKYKPKKINGRSQVQPKLVRRQAEWRYSALSEPFLSSDRMFSVNPVTFEDKEAADQNELVINWQFRTKLNRTQFIDDLIRSTVDDGTCVVQTGWERKTYKVKEQAPVWSYYAISNDESMQAFQEALEMRNENIRGFNESAPEEIKAALDYYDETGLPVTAVLERYEEVEVEKVSINQPTATIHDPRNVIIDPSCQGKLEKARFVIVSFETSQIDLKNDRRYKNLDQVDWENASPINEPGHYTQTPSDFQLADAMMKRVVAYEYWGYYDIHGTGQLVPIVATWIGNVLIRMQESPFSDGKLPFVVITYMPVKRQLYGEPDAELLGDNQAILGAVTRGMVDLLARSANAQKGIAKGVLDPLNRSRYDSGQDYEFNPTSHPDGAIYQHKFSDIPVSAMEMIGLQNQEAEALTGVKSFSGGMSGEAYGDVAAGIRGMLDAASKREMAILRRIAKGLGDIGTKFISMNADFLSESEVIRVTNQEFIEVKREDLKGNFDLIVDISTAEVDNNKAQDLGFMLQTIGPNMDVRITMQILAEIADLKRMPDLAEKLRRWLPEPSPEEQELMQLEIEQKKAEIEKIRSEIEFNKARAAKELADADKANLDFVEQETGTKHARDMEKQKAQSEGNQNLQVTKALTTPMKEGDTSPNISAAIGYNELSKLADSIPAREAAAQANPQYNLGSSQFDPTLDPALNQGFNF
ncbi:portal protein [Alcaligenes phage vB_Af_QDWS595]|uniref:Portal protein n=1 Tax=Alcaligenes phage vB_Af_QDWS595 TaxID=2877946 RepID=A0AAE8Y249_9CAUD|nr:portal protein [Alcaligenes phage vB_Af_QDWS595]UCR75499.1 portal protein [Alcaligenes phage vB_Af_QDWS595]